MLIGSRACLPLRQFISVVSTSPAQYFFIQADREHRDRAPPERRKLTERNTTAQALVKVSILLLYHRLFGINKWYRISLYVAGTLTIMWWMAAFLDSIFQCRPVKASWDHSIRDAKCQDIRASALGTGIANMILDILFLILPLPMIWKLQVTRRIKISLTGIFLLGALYVSRSVFSGSFLGGNID